MKRESPPPTREEAHAFMLRNAGTLEGLEGLRRQMPDGSTLADALRLHRKLAQLRRQPSRVMRDDDAT